MKIISFILALIACGNLMAKDFHISKDGSSSYVIAVGKNKIPAEVTAADELRKYLKLITGAKYAIVNESEVEPGSKAFYVGQTEFARSKGIDFAKLGREEWIIKSAPDGNIILSGGRTRGTLYAVFDFLEKQCGCRWLDEHNEVIPSKACLKISDLDIKKQPRFRIRMIWDTMDWYPKSYIFKTKNKGQAYADAAWGWGFKYGSPVQHHSFYAYSKTFLKNKDTWFSLDKHGKRLHAKDGVGPGQICLTNKQARENVLQQLRGYIKKDREEAEKNNNNYPLIYDISQNDNEDRCVCPACKALAEKEGSYSAPLLSFINYIATEIKKDYPDVCIRTFAYQWSTKPPKTIKPADNVIIHLAILGFEYGGKERRDTMRKLTAPTNEYANKVFTDWSSIAKVGMWDYWTLYSTDFPAPYSNINAIADNIRYCADNNVVDMFIESEGTPDVSFFPLKRYLGYKLMENPYQDEKIIIDEFISDYYGKAAAPYIKELISYVEKRQEEQKEAIGSKYINMRKYLDKDFFVTSFKLLDKAEAAMGKDSKRIANIRRERIPFLSGLFLRWAAIDGIEKVFNHSKLFEEFKKEVDKSLAYYHYDLAPENFKSKFRKQFDKMLKTLKYSYIKVKLPAYLKNKKSTVLPWYYFREIGRAELVKDRDAAGGKAYTLGPEVKNRSTKTYTDFGIYDANARKTIASGVIRKQDVPRDEKYHLVKICEVKFVNPLAFFYGGSSWEIQCDLMPVVKPGKTFDAYASVKFTGPEYIKNSNKKDSLSVDYLVFIEK